MVSAVLGGIGAVMAFAALRLFGGDSTPQEPTSTPQAPVLASVPPRGRKTMLSQAAETNVMISSHMPSEHGELLRRLTGWEQACVGCFQAWATVHERVGGQDLGVIETSLKEWKQDRPLAFFFAGATQIGKTLTAQALRDGYLSYLSVADAKTKCSAYMSFKSPPSADAIRSNIAGALTGCDGYAVIVFDETNDLPEDSIRELLLFVPDMIDPATAAFKHEDKSLSTRRAIIVISRHVDNSRVASFLERITVGKDGLHVSDMDRKKQVDKEMLDDITSLFNSQWHVVRRSFSSLAGSSGVGGLVLFSPFTELSSRNLVEFHVQHMLRFPPGLELTAKPGNVRPTDVQAVVGDAQWPSTYELLLNVDPNVVSFATSKEVLQYDRRQSSKQCAASLGQCTPQSVRANQCEMVPGATVTETTQNMLQALGVLGCRGKRSLSGASEEASLYGALRDALDTAALEQRVQKARARRVAFVTAKVHQLSTTVHVEVLCNVQKLPCDVSDAAQPEWCECITDSFRATLGNTTQNMLAFTWIRAVVLAWETSDGHIESTNEPLPCFMWQTHAGVPVNTCGA